ncbi:HpcH/HpaI aldolase/citrate lyase family protein [Rhodococcus opacus]|uniref:CoA ester lyase n=1 Tax=Rhodococcus opacus TaxID=37919 RepID=A0A2S8II91_RHOOP|nr:aldolase/citrate lyase family protein [Rhodococcus opacus]PQP14504.1 CoA ester lyase [Rhodococcus opacus]
MHLTQPTATAIPNEHARSWLLVSGAKPDTFAAATNSPADAVILDLEDGVIASGKPAAREAVRTFLTDNNAWVRISPAATADGAADLRALGDLPGLLGVMVAKTESATHIDWAAAGLPGIPILALVESALGIERAYEIASATATIRLAFGTGDFRRDTLASADPEALAYARGRLVVASRAAGIAGPIDGPCLTGVPDLSRALATTRSMGMTGMLCMFEHDTATVNTQLSPSEEQLARADEIISRLGANGEHIADGSELPKLARAKLIHELARTFDPR